MSKLTLKKNLILDIKECIKCKSIDKDSFKHLNEYDFDLFHFKYVDEEDKKKTYKFNLTLYKLQNSTRFYTGKPVYINNFKIPTLTYDIIKQLDVICNIKRKSKNLFEDSDSEEEDNTPTKIKLTSEIDIKPQHTETSYKFNRK